MSNWLSPALVAGFVVLATQKTWAHDWYPFECCHEHDCAPVDDIVKLSDNSLRVTSRMGSTVVPASFPTRDSHDHRMHVCMQPDGLGGMRPICVFIPPML